jgi:aminoglycoside phosphotransferase (APT) family kinase protein
MELKLINQGRTAEVYDIGNHQILKLFRSGFPLAAIENECRIVIAINQCTLPLPKFFGKMEYEGRIGLIYEYIQGQSMLNSIMSKPWAFFAYAKKMAELHAAIHQTKVAGIPRQKEALEFFINRTDLPAEDKTKIIQELKGLNGGDFLCHGDMHPDNILFSTNKPVVIDWMTATIGNPAGDVARTIVILKYSPVPSHMPLLIRIVLNILKSVLCNAYLRYYIRLTGTGRAEIDRWRLPIAAARLFENGPQAEKKALYRFIQRQLKDIK